AAHLGPRARLLEPRASVAPNLSPAARRARASRPDRRSTIRTRTVIAAAVAALLSPSAASAHAVLLGTTPSNDNVVEKQPALVTLRFNEAVETAFGSLRVYNAAAKRVDKGEVRRPDDRSVA